MSDLDTKSPARNAEDDSASQRHKRILRAGREIKRRPMERLAIARAISRSEFKP
jgi:hypothetical protein